MTDHRIHAIFNASAAGSLRQALLMVNRSQDVICLSENFSFGPIEADDPRNRIRWIKRELHYPWWNDVAKSSMDFLKVFEDDVSHVTAWVSWKESMSYAGFLWWLSHVKDFPVSLVEIENLSITSAENLVSFLDSANPILPNQRIRYKDIWTRLCIENAPIRIISDGDLISAPITYFDGTLLEIATYEWQKMAKIVAGMLDIFFYSGINQVSDIVLVARLAALAKAGKLEWRGDLSNMRQCELRLPSSSSELETSGTLRN